MSWTPRTGGSNSISSAGSTSLSATSTDAVIIGDCILLSVLVDSLAGAIGSRVSDATHGDYKDSLGNVYVRIRQDSSAFSVQEIWLASVTSPGTPTVRIQLENSPGTTTATYIALNIDPFTDCSTNIRVAGHAGQLQNTGNYTATDAISSGVIVPIQNDTLIYGNTADLLNGGDPGVGGTGFTELQLSAGGGLLPLLTEYRIQSVAASIAVTFTATVNPAAYVTQIISVGMVSRGNNIALAAGMVPAFGDGPVPYIFYPA